jgi:DNA repair protein RecO (recombination protein O)
MPSYPLRALVLRKTKLGETDTILTLLADDGRQVRAVAKGLRRPGSKYGARLEPYAIVDLLIHTGRNLDVISEARTVESNALLREDLDLSAAASVVADLLDKISVEGQAEPVLYPLAVTTLETFQTAEKGAVSAVVTAFLIKALAMHGYRPELEECAACGGRLEDSSSLSLEHGGVICGACRAADASSLRCPPQARAWLRKLLHSTLAEIASSQMPQAAVYDCFILVRAFVEYHVPARLKALDFYAGMLTVK